MGLRTQACPVRAGPAWALAGQTASRPAVPANGQPGWPPALYEEQSTPSGTPSSGTLDAGRAAWRLGAAFLSSLHWLSASRSCVWFKRRTNTHLKLACNSASIAVAQGFGDKRLHINFALILCLNHLETSRFEPQQPARHTPPAQRPQKSPARFPNPGEASRLLKRVQTRSNRSRFITLTHAATKSRTNFSFASSLA
jgi:hypothetical protein